MKKYFPIAAISVLLAACGGQDKQPETPAPVDSTNVQTETPVITDAQYFWSADADTA